MLSSPSKKAFPSSSQVSDSSTYPISRLSFLQNTTLSFRRVITQPGAKVKNHLFPHDSPLRLYIAKCISFKKNCLLYLVKLPVLLEKSNRFIKLKASY